MTKCPSGVQLQSYCLPSRKFSRSVAAFAAVSLAFQLCSSQAATIVVTNAAPAGPGTLRSAITNAQNGDIITFAITGIITNSVPAGLVISNNISIIGPGPNLLFITGSNWWRAFSVNSGATSSISGLAFTNCYAGPSMDGGAIYNSGNLLLSNCLFTACRSTSGPTTPANGGPGGAAGNGGAIFNAGTLVAESCQFLNNAANRGGAGSYGYLNAAMTPTSGGIGGNGGSGGAVYDTGTASFFNCTFGWNGSGGGGAGGAGVTGYYK